MRAHLASSAVVGRRRSASRSRVKIEPLRRGANTAQASSAVKLRNGAIQRSMACVICHSAVCAERRASDFGAVVYRRSFSTSR